MSYHHDDMQSEPTTPLAPTFPFHMRRPSYFRCRRVLEDLHLFQDLVRHHWRMPDHLTAARPLRDLLPPGTREDQHQLMMEQRINRLIPLVTEDMSVAGMKNEIIYEHSEPKRVAGHFEYNEKEEVFDVIEDYFDLPHRRDSFDAVMASVERTIGIYEDAKKTALLRTFNPLNWLAILIRLPLTIMERAGLAEDPQTHSKVASVYTWILKITMLILLLLLASKLGLSIKWSDLIRVPN
jgi:hypothetical protein